MTDALAEHIAEALLATPGHHTPTLARVAADVARDYFERRTMRDGQECHVRSARRSASHRLVPVEQNEELINQPEENR